MKASKGGFLALVQYPSGAFETIPYFNPDAYIQYGILEPVFLNGEVLRDQNFEDIRAAVMSGNDREVEGD